MSNLRQRALLLLLATIGLSLAGCAVPLTAPLQPARNAEPPFNGAVLEPARELPSFELRRTNGQAFTLAETRGRLSLFFFGYTTCPDVCPLTLAHMAQLRRELGTDARAVDAYFVTVDPERDTPERLAEYVSKFDPAIVPLSGTPEQLESVRAIFGVVAQRREAPESAAGYFMDHTAAQYLVDSAARMRLVYPHGTAPSDLAADIRRLIPRGTQTSPPRLAIEAAWARAARTGGSTAVYLTIRNDGSREDTLLSAATEAATATELHQSFMDNGVMRMRPAGTPAIPSGRTLTLEPGGLHIMLMDLRRELSPGTELRLSLRFEHAGELSVTAPVRPASGMANLQGG